GSVTVATGGAWTTMGTGSFAPDANVLNASYVPSPADTAARTVRLVLTSTGNGTCNAVTDTMTITMNPIPVVNAGSDVTVCADVNSILLNGASVVNASGGTWVTSGTGAFTPNTSTVNPSYIPSSNDKASGN